MDVPLLREGKPVSRTEIARQVAKSRRTHSLLLNFCEDVNLSLSCWDFDCLFLFFLTLCLLCDLFIHFSTLD